MVLALLTVAYVLPGIDVADFTGDGQTIVNVDDEATGTLNVTAGGAITDSGNLFGAVEFHKTLKKLGAYTEDVQSHSTAIIAMPNEASGRAMGGFPQANARHRGLDIAAATGDLGRHVGAGAGHAGDGAVGQSNLQKPAALDRNV